MAKLVSIIPLLFILWGCAPDDVVEGCSEELCEIWVCGHERPACPCGDLCERPECAEMVLFARDPEDGSCQELSSVCDVPEGWEYFFERELCEEGDVMCGSQQDCESDEVCDIRSCAVDAVGTCTVRPLECPESDEPTLYDCDGNAYESDCDRLNAGARLAEVQPTLTPTGSMTNQTDCTDTGVWARNPLSGACSYYANSCFAPADWPYFLTREECEGPLCSVTPVWAYDPEARDCVEYESDCDVPQDVEFFSDLAVCQSINRCTRNDECGDGQVCDIEGCSSSTGLCVPLPDDCVIVASFDASAELAAEVVCGCDGVTYSSDCDRLIAGVALAYRGYCGSE